MLKLHSKCKFTHNGDLDNKSRILIIWDSTYLLNIILYSNDQYISCILHNFSGLSLIYTVVYAYNLSDLERIYGSILML